MDEDLVPSAPVASPASPSGFRSVAGRTAWTVADQAVSSLTSLIVLVIFAHRLDAKAFGALSIALSVVTLAIGAARALATDALLVRHSDHTASDWIDAVEASSATALVVGFIASGILVSTMSFVGNDLKQTLLVLTLAIPGLCLQDSWRFVFFAAGRPTHAFLNDSAWVLVLVAVAYISSRSSNFSASDATLLWVTGGLLASCLGLVQVRIVAVRNLPKRSLRWKPSLNHVPQWLITNRDLALRFLIEFAMLTGTTQVVLLAIGARHGLESAGALRGAALILGPAGVVANGVLAATVPEGARMAQNPSRVTKLVLSLASLATALMIAWTFFVLFMPSVAGERILGGQWFQSRHLILPLGLSYAGLIMATITAGGLRSLGSAKASLRAISTVSGLLLVSGLIGAQRSAFAACAGMAFTSWIGAAVCSSTFLRAAEQPATSTYTKR